MNYAAKILFIFIFMGLILAGTSVEATTLFQKVGIASSPNPVGSGARAIGMGGAFIGIADDATAASWNPGGLIQLETPELSLVVDYISRTEDFSSDEHPESSNSGENDYADINYFSAAYPFNLLNRNMVVSLNYQRLYDFKRSFDYNYNLSSSSGDVEQSKAFDQDGSLGALGMAGAIQVTPRISLGATLNIWTDQLWWDNGWEETFSQHSVWDPGVGTPMVTDTTCIDEYSSFRGVNANFGILWNAVSSLTVGAVVKTPFTANMIHEYTYEQTGMTTPTYIKEDVELTMPMSLGLGLAWRFSDAFSTDLDVYWTDWSEYMLTDDQGNEFSPIDGRPASESDVKDTTQVRLGGEYLFIREGAKVIIPVRAGIFYDPEPSEGDVRDFYGFSLGSGIAYKSIVFDLAYQLRWGKDVDTGNIIATTEADITQHSLLASVIWHF